MTATLDTRLGWDLLDGLVVEEVLVAAWPRFTAETFQTALAEGWADHGDHPRHALSDAVHRLAGRLPAILTGAGVPVADADMVAGWLARAAIAETPDPDLGGQAPTVAQALEDAATRTGPLVAPEGFDAPLLDLAADIGARHPLGRLVVEITDTLDGTRGYTIARDGLVVLAVGAPAITWAHEIAHLLDPDLDAVDRDERERFADLLAPALLEHEPPDVPAAGPLVAAALAGRTTPTDEELPAPGLPTRLAFAALAMRLLPAGTPAAPPAPPRSSWERDPQAAAGLRAEGAPA